MKPTLGCFRSRPAAFLTAALAVLVYAALSRAADAGPGLHYYYPVPKANPPQIIEADVCVYGGTPGGVATAVQAARMGKKAVLVAFRRHVGGMTSGGLTATDVGNRGAIGGIAQEFYQRVGRLTGFRPAEAEKTFRALLKEAGVPTYFEHRLKEVAREENRITALRTENGKTFKARVFVDATYEGDLLAAAGVAFHVGREGNARYGETYNGVYFGSGHNFTTRVDPYRVEGKPDSGLLWGISAETPGERGQADSKVQAYNFRMWLTGAPDRLPFPRPAGYDRERYALLLRYLKRQPRPALPFQLHWGDCNNTGAFSTDYIGGNYAWPEGDYATREKIFQDHVNYQQGLVWFVANDPEVPEDLREKVRGFGLPRDEFVETGGWPHELYVREGRRMLSAYVMTEHDCQGRRVAEDPVGLASYTMDSHNCRRIVIDGAARNEGNVEIGVPRPYPVSYRSLVPREEQCANLLVPVCLSSSHIAYGSIRMEPVFMVVGQSAGTAAALAIDGKTSVQKVDYGKLRERLLADKQVLKWEGPPEKKQRSAAPAPPGIEVDDAQAEVTGEWQNARVVTPFAGVGYLHDGNADKGRKRVKFVPDLPADGAYDVYLMWSCGANRATNVPVEIVHAGGTARITVNQRERDGWVKVFNGTFKAGRDGSVTIRNDGTDGYVIADAVRWVRAVPRAPGKRVVCFGDSITKQGYPAVLAELLGQEVVNAGVGGNSTRAGLQRIHKDVLDRKPDVVVILFGTNDCRLSDPQAHVPVADYEANLGKMIDLCRGARAEVVLCTLPPINPGPYFKRHGKEKFEAAGGLEKVLADYRAAALRVAEARKVPAVDLNQLLAKDPAWLSEDGVHPTAHGTRRIAHFVGRALAPLLGVAAPKEGSR